MLLLVPTEMDDDVLLDTPRERDVLVGLKVQSGYKQGGHFCSPRTPPQKWPHGSERQQEAPSFDWQAVDWQICAV